jgi:hypothetical protein
MKGNGVKHISGFFAYPASVPLVAESARQACRLLESGSRTVSLRSWEEMDIPGRFIRDEILESIGNSDFLVADISRLNFNVVYEIGFAIGRGKRVLLLKHQAVAPASPTPMEVGIFDTIGYKEYSNAETTVQFLNVLDDIKPLHIKSKINQKTPIYLVQPKIKTDYDGYITAGIKKSYLYFRSYDPSENTRLAGPEAIQNVAESLGIILHFLPNDHVDAPVHNIRSAFVAGLADGMDKHTLYIQSGETPVPIDLRDFVVTCKFVDQFKAAISDLADRVYADGSGGLDLEDTRSQPLLTQIDLGASAAENEITSLGEYYVEIEAFRRALRKEVRLVTGRKGSGKTAIFFMLRNEVRASRANVVLDLKPEGYQLLKLKDAVVDLMAVGTVEHTITAFWEYLLWLEICHKLLEKDQENHKRNHNLFEPYQRLKALYITDAYSSEGDFSERLKSLLREIVQQIQATHKEGSKVALDAAKVTELVYRHNFPKLKSEILSYLAHKDELWLLFDNIDKGWSSQGVKPEDLVILRALIEATRKLERELRRHNVTAHTIVFLRNDVFENLVDSTSDRGKETRANVDWDDAEMLRELVRRRASRNLPAEIGKDFSRLWPAMCTPKIDGEDSAQYLIDRCLMRPRSLLDLIGHCRGYAINLGHDKITVDDIKKGCSAFSVDLLAEINLEIRDVFPAAEDLLYAFIGRPRGFTSPELGEILSAAPIGTKSVNEVINLLLWFGFLGFKWTDGSERYIYSFHYNMKVLDGTRQALARSGTLSYAINPAFAPALGLTEV